MAEASVLVSQDQFSCPICLDLLQNPVAIPCGHSFCMDCITDCWDEEDRKGIYNCPQCRQAFTPRPVLGKNTILADMVEKLRQTGIHSDSQTPFYAGPGDVECDVCIGRKRKAVKSCLVCLSSYCETHFRVHNDLNPGKKHKVIDAAGKLEDLICSHHDKLLEVFCHNDQRCICVLCVMDEHKGHDTVSAAAERIEKQKQVGESQRKYRQIIQERQKHLQELKEIIRFIRHSTQAAVEDSERIFTEMINWIKKRCSEVPQLFRDQERAEISQVEELMEKLEQEIDEMQRRDNELEQLSQTEVHTHYLQSFRALCSTDPGDSSLSHSVCSDVSFEQVKKNVSQLKDKLEDLLEQEIYNISRQAKVIRIFPSQELSTRKDFLKYSCQLSLDPNTAQSQLHLSDGNKDVTCKHAVQLYPDNPERFDYMQQVLCREAVSGRCYWEVEWSGAFSVSIALCYKDTKRKGNRRVLFGYNKQSWSLECNSSGCSVVHNSKRTKLLITPGTRIGVYVDHKAGILSFYTVSSNTMTLLHIVQTTFTQPLYPGFWLPVGSKVKLCH